MNDSLLIYILSHKDLCEISSRAVWECLNLEPFIFINLSRLDIGKYQSNTFSESRFFINRSIPSDDYVGIITANYEDKYRGLWPLKWPRFLPKEPRVVWTPSLAAPDWRDITEHRHPGMMDIILSMSKDLDIAPPVKGQSIWSNNFICSRDVYIGYLDYFKRCFDWVDARYDWHHLPYEIPSTANPNRHAGFLTERFAMMYFADLLSRKKIEIHSIPAI